MTFDQKAHLQLTALLTPDELPEKYRATLTPNRCATPMLLELVERIDDLSADTRLLLAQAMARPDRDLSYVSPSGFFLLHYDTIGSHVVPLTDSDSNSVPDFIERCAAYLDTTRQYHLDQGFLMPPSDGELGGDSLYDVYFSQIEAYGYLALEGPGPEPWNDGISHLILHRNYYGFPPNDDPEGSQRGTAKVTCAHELHHAGATGI